MTDALDRVLRLVAEGRLTAEEAGPILAALDDDAGSEGVTERVPSGASAGPATAGRSLRLEVTEGGVVRVRLRVPASLGELGLGEIPGLTRQAMDRIRTAVAHGTRGPVFEAIGDDGDGVRIVVE